MLTVIVIKGVFVLIIYTIWGGECSLGNPTYVSQNSAK